MALFAIADLHLSLGEDKPMDVFAGWNDYTSRLENNWRKLVTDNDTVVVSGDISWAMKLEETLTDFTFIENLIELPISIDPLSLFSSSSVFILAFIFEKDSPLSYSSSEQFIYVFTVLFLCLLGDINAVVFIFL